MLLLARIKVPLPALVRPAVPATTALMVAVRPAARLLTVICGAAPARVRVLAATPLLSNTQLAALAVLVSPMISVCSVREESRCTTVGSLVRLTDLKSTAASGPSPIALSTQLVAVLQLRPVAAVFQMAVVTMSAARLPGGVRE